MYADFNKRIINVDPRWAGSVNDAYAFNCSPVGNLCNNEGLGKFMLLADSGYVFPLFLIWYYMGSSPLIYCKVKIQQNARE